MKTRGSSASARACASRMASRYVMLIGPSIRIFSPRLQQVCRRQRAPVLLVRVRSGLALDHADGFLDLLDRLAPPPFDGAPVLPALPQNLVLGHLEAIAAGRGLLDLRVDIVGGIVLAVAAEPEQPGNDQLRSAALAGPCDC